MDMDKDNTNPLVGGHPWGVTDPVVCGRNQRRKAMPTGSDSNPGEWVALPPGYRGPKGSRVLAFRRHHIMPFEAHDDIDLLLMGHRDEGSFRVYTFACEDDMEWIGTGAW